jgi:hypothetical protein
MVAPLAMALIAMIKGILGTSESRQCLLLAHLVVLVPSIARWGSFAPTGQCNFLPFLTTPYILVMLGMGPYAPVHLVIVAILLITLVNALDVRIESINGVQYLLMSLLFREYKMAPYLTVESPVLSHQPVLS